MSYRTSSCMSVGLMAHVSSIGNIRDLIPFRLPTGQTRQVGRFRQASSLAWMNITTCLHGRKPGERKQVLSVQIRGKKRTHPLAYCPPGSRVVCADYLAHLLRRCTRLLEVLPSRQQSAMCSICPARIVLEDCHMQGKTVYSCLSPWGGW